MYLVCVLFVVGGWPKLSQTAKIGQLPSWRFIQANQPTKTNTNSNTRPAIQLHSNKTQPIFPGAQASYKSLWFESHLRLSVAFFVEKISNPPKHNWFCYQGWPMASATQKVGLYHRNYSSVNFSHDPGRNQNWSICIWNCSLSLKEGVISLQAIDCTWFYLWDMNFTSAIFKLLW